MQIVIDIDEWKYKSICEGIEASKRCGVATMNPYIDEAIYKGTPLPKGHGKLFDVNDLLDRIGLEDNDANREENVGEIITLEDFDYIPTIIPADTESEGEQ
jgi:hypothetical protein